MSEVAKPRPEYRNINALGDLPSYRWPLAALVSGMHRASGKRQTGHEQGPKGGREASHQ